MDCRSLRNDLGSFFFMLFHNINNPKQAFTYINWRIDGYKVALKAQNEMTLNYIPRLSHISELMGSTGFTPVIKTFFKRVAEIYHFKMLDSDSQIDNHVTCTSFDFRGKPTEERN